MKIYLADIKLTLIGAWKESFRDCPDVEVFSGSIFEIPDCQCFISPANSFGFMNGGIDLLYSDRLGWEIQRTLQALLKGPPFYGELLVGQAAIVGIPKPFKKLQCIISAPTMRIPETLTDSVNAYLATRAALRIAQVNGLKSVAFPGMGTGIGALSPTTCAKQMRAAYDEVIAGKVPQFPTLAGAVQYHYALAEGTNDFPT